MYKSLKDFIAHLEREGELIRVSAPVSSRFEIAELTDRQAKSEGGGKALLFENTDAEFPVVTNMMGSSKRMAMALGVERLEDIGSRIEALLGDALSPKASLWDKMKMLPLLADVAKWFPKNISGRGACQEVVWQGDEVDLERLPMLHSWESDGGAFVTLPMVNTIDPESGMRNVGMYRMQRFDKHTTGMHWHIHKTGARHYDAYKRLGKRMPVVVALGGDPAYTYADRPDVRRRHPALAAGVAAAPHRGDVPAAGGGVPAARPARAAAVGVFVRHQLQLLPLAPDAGGLAQVPLADPGVDGGRAPQPALGRGVDGRVRPVVLGRGAGGGGGGHLPQRKTRRPPAQEPPVWHRRPRKTPERINTPAILCEHTVFCPKNTCKKPGVVL